MYSNTIHYSDNALKKTAEVVGTMCASMLPVLAIVILYLIQSMGRRLGAIAAFTFIFSAVLGIFSNGRRVEIFAATAGYVLYWRSFELSGIDVVAGLRRCRSCLLVQRLVLAVMQRGLVFKVQRNHSYDEGVIPSEKTCAVNEI
jgi:hypothetical protein